MGEITKCLGNQCLNIRRLHKQRLIDVHDAYLHKYTWFFIKILETSINLNQNNFSFCITRRKKYRHFSRCKDLYVNSDSVSTHKFDQEWIKHEHGFLSEKNIPQLAPALLDQVASFVHCKPYLESQYC